MNAPERLPVVLVVVSDRAARGERADATAALLRPALAAAGFTLSSVRVVPDERPVIAETLRVAAREVSVVLTTGGTGVTPRDVTPEATRDVIEFEIPGLCEEMRRRSAETTPLALGSRATAGVIGRAIVVNLPGRPEGAVECFGFVAPVLAHLVALRRGPVPDGAHGEAPR
jgi:molybdenum cofactor synthesis domain-containing protein